MAWSNPFVARWQAIGAAVIALLVLAGLIPPLYDVEGAQEAHDLIASEGPGETVLVYPPSLAASFHGLPVHPLRASNDPDVPSAEGIVTGSDLWLVTGEPIDVTSVLVTLGGSVALGTWELGDLLVVRVARPLATSSMLTIADLLPSASATLKGTPCAPWDGLGLACDGGARRVGWAVLPVGDVPTRVMALPVPKKGVVELTIPSIPADASLVGSVFVRDGFKGKGRVKVTTTMGDAKPITSIVTAKKHVAAVHADTKGDIGSLVSLTIEAQGLSGFHGFVYVSLDVSPLEVKP